MALTSPAGGQDRKTGTALRRPCVIGIDEELLGWRWSTGTGTTGTTAPSTTTAAKSAAEELTVSRSRWRGINLGFLIGCD